METTITPHLWPNMSVAHPAAALVVNVCPLDVTEENGATELWPGAHLLPFNGQMISPAIEAHRREISPPVPAISRKGSLVIRDMRLWHRGVPNHSNCIRHMIAMIHRMHWLQRHEPLLFNTGCEEAFPHCDLDHNVQFTEKRLEYLLNRFATIVD